MGRIESNIQNQIRDYLIGKAYWPIKISLCSENGFPDLIVIGFKTIFFVEVKSPGCKAAPLQKYIHARLMDLGVDVIVADSKQDIIGYINGPRNKMHKRKFHKKLKR